MVHNQQDYSEQSSRLLRSKILREPSVPFKVGEKFFFPKTCSLVLSYEAFEGNCPESDIKEVLRNMDEQDVFLIACVEDHEFVEITDEKLKV